MTTLTCEDNMALMARYPDNYFELAIVDPPYGINADLNLRKLEGTKQGRGCGKRTVFTKGAAIFDSSIPDEDYFNELFRVSKNQIIWGGNYMTDFLRPSKSWIVWNKETNGNFADAELAWSSFNIPVRLFTWIWNGMLQQDMKNKEVRTHPTQKPVALYRWLLQNYAKKGDKILDTHLGSMSIAIACDMEGFDLTGCELDPEYYRDGIKRLETFRSQTTLF